MNFRSHQPVCKKHHLQSFHVETDWLIANKLNNTSNLNVTKTLFGLWNFKIIKINNRIKTYLLQVFLLRLNYLRAFPFAVTACWQTMPNYKHWKLAANNQFTMPSNHIWHSIIYSLPRVVARHHIWHSNIYSLPRVVARLSTSCTGKLRHKANSATQCSRCCQHLDTIKLHVKDTKSKITNIIILP